MTLGAWAEAKENELFPGKGEPLNKQIDRLSSQRRWEALVVLQRCREVRSVGYVAVLAAQWRLCCDTLSSVSTVTSQSKHSRVVVAELIFQEPNHVLLLCLDMFFSHNRDVDTRWIRTVSKAYYRSYPQNYRFFHRSQ